MHNTTIILCSDNLHAKLVECTTYTKKIIRYIKNKKNNLKIYQTYIS